MAMSASEQARLMVVALGRTSQAYADQNYCYDGVMSMANDNVWGEVSGYKRAVTFYKREGGVWCYYCQYSMTTDTNDYEPTIRTLLDSTVCPHSSGGADPSQGSTPTTYPDTMPMADDVFQQAYLSDPNGDLVKVTQRACANMRDEPSMSTACIALSPHGSSSIATEYFPVSVCCTSDYCLMRDGSVAFSHLTHTDGRRYLLREGVAVAMLDEPSSSVAECEAATVAAGGRYFPLLGSAALATACSSDDAATTVEAEPINASLAVAVAVPLPADGVFERASAGLSSHDAVLAATQAWCANMRVSRSIATSCMRVPQSGGGASSMAWVAVSVCCSSDLCEITQTAAEGRFAYSAHVEGGSTKYFFVRAGATVQAIAPPTATAAGCEAAVAMANASGAYYPLLTTTMVSDICAASPPPTPPRSSPPPPMSQPTLDDGGGGLSTGAAIGVAVGVCAAVLVGLALLVVRCCREKTPPIPGKMQA